MIAATFIAIGLLLLAVSLIVLYRDRVASRRITNEDLDWMRHLRD